MADLTYWILAGVAYIFVRVFVAVYKFSVLILGRGNWVERMMNRAIFRIDRAVRGLDRGSLGQ